MVSQDETPKHRLRRLSLGIPPSSDYSQPIAWRFYLYRPPPEEVPDDWRWFSTYDSEHFTPEDVPDELVIGVLQYTAVGERVTLLSDHYFWDEEGRWCGASELGLRRRLNDTNLVTLHIKNGHELNFERFHALLDSMKRDPDFPQARVDIDYGLSLEG